MPRTGGGFRIHHGLPSGQAEANIYQPRKKTIQRMNSTQRRTKFLSPDEFRGFLETVRVSRSPFCSLAYDFFLFLGNYGLRLSEALMVKFSDIEELKSWGKLPVFRLKKRERVGRKWVYLPPQKDYVSLHQKEIEPLLELTRRRRSQTSGDHLFPISKRKAQYLFTYYLEKSGLMDYKPWLTLHCLRHTCGVILYEASGDLEFVRIRLGHASIRTTEIYATMSLKRQLEIGSRREIVT